MTDATASLQARYAAALLDHVEGRHEAARVRTQELGRVASRAGVGLVDLADIHHQAQMQAMAGAVSSASLARMEAARRCFRELVSAFESTQSACREANAALRHFNDTLEAEIKRVAHILDAQTGQLLAAINLEVSELQRGPTELAGDKIRQVKALLRLVEGQLRHLTREIRPAVLDDLGLVPAIEFLRDGVEHRSGLRVLVEGPPGERFPQWIEITVYRVVQEALDNVVKHARASEVTVRLDSQESRLICSIRDDGVGFDAGSVGSQGRVRGFGLVGMQERLQRVGGHLEVRSSPGRGTELMVAIPTAAEDRGTEQEADEGIRSRGAGRG